MAAVDDFLCRGGDQPRLLIVQRSKAHIRTRGSRLDPRKRMDDLDGKALAPDREIMPGTFRLRTPVSVGRHLDGAHGIRLPAARSVFIAISLLCVAVAPAQKQT